MDIPKPSFAGLTSGGNKTPLQEFKGRLVGINPSTEWENVYYNFQFAELQVLKSLVPFLFPIASIAIKYSKSENSGWGILGDSYAVLLGISRDDVDPEKQIGQVQHWLCREHAFGKDKNTGETMKGIVWECQSLEGVGAAGTGTGPVGGASASDVALALLNGKNEIDFFKAAFSNDAVKGDANLASSILDKTWLVAMEATGKVAKDQSTGIYTVVG